MRRSGLVGSVATLQACRDRLVGCSFWTLRFAGLFKWGQFEPEMILLAVGWYLPFFAVVP